MPFRNADSPLHQNTPETVEKGNALLAEAKRSRDLGVTLSRQIEELEKHRDEAFAVARNKHHEAMETLCGTRSYAY